MPKREVQLQLYKQMPYLNIMYASDIFYVVFIFTHTHIYIYIYIYIFIYIYIYIYTFHIYIHIYIYIYVKPHCDKCNSFPSSANFENWWSYTSSPLMCLLGVNRDRFTFYDTCYLQCNN